MKYILRINTDHTTDTTLKADYNTNTYYEDELYDICNEWEREDNDGTIYTVEDDGEEEQVKVYLYNPYDKYGVYLDHNGVRHQNHKPVCYVKATYSNGKYIVTKSGASKIVKGCYGCFVYGKNKTFEIGDWQLYYSPFGAGLVRLWQFC